MRGTERQRETERDRQTQRDIPLARGDLFLDVEADRDSPLGSLGSARSAHGRHFSSTPHTASTQIIINLSPFGSARAWPFHCHCHHPRRSFAPGHASLEGVNESVSVGANLLRLDAWFHTSNFLPLRYVLAVNVLERPTLAPPTLPPASTWPLAARGPASPSTLAHAASRSARPPSSRRPAP